MSRKNKQQESVEARPVVRSARPRVTFRIMNNCAPVPVARPADQIQLTPIVQPVPLVPYSTQLQPLAQFDEGGDYDYGYDD